MHIFNREINQLNHMIEQKISHSYVDQYIRKPLIDNDKLFILHSLYKDVEILKSKKQKYMITIMLVQIALDTHELVPRNGGQNIENTEKQLSVLAGDYYSGLYYLLLSELEDIEMIQILAKAIKKINENKMILFYENVETIDEWIHTLREIESLLFTEVASFLRKDETIIPVIKELLLYNRLQKERELIIDNKTSNMKMYMKNSHSNIDDRAVITAIENITDNCKRRLDDLLSQLPHHFKGLQHKIRDKMKFMYNTSVAEEG